MNVSDPIASDGAADGVSDGGSDGGSDGATAAGESTWPTPEVADAVSGSFDYSTVAGDAHVAPGLAGRFRDVLGRFASGVTVVSAMSEDGPVGMTCQSFSSVSLDPPLVLFVPATTSRAWPLIHAAGHFTVNLLAAGQKGISHRFATRGVDKYAGVDWQPAPRTGAPRLEGCLGWIDCSIDAVHEAGDHLVVLGRVLELVPGPAEEPLVFYRSAYHRLAE